MIRVAIAEDNQLEKKKKAAEAAGRPDLNVLFICNMPFRAISKMTAGQDVRILSERRHSCTKDPVPSLAGETGFVIVKSSLKSHVFATSAVTYRSAHRIPL